MKKTISILILFFPMLALAQEAESLIYEPPIWEKTWWVIRDFIAWPSLCLIIISIGTWVLLTPIKKRIKKVKMVHASIVVGLFSIWYFYLCMSYKGSYVSHQKWINGEDSSTIVIGNNFQWDDDIVESYHVNPFQRMLWVETPYLLNDALPVKLRWNKIVVPVFKMGWVEYEKTKANQSREPTRITSADEGNN